MKLPESIPITELAKKYNAEIIGDESILVTGINEIHKVSKGDLTFADKDKYIQLSLESQASVIVLKEKVLCPEGKALLIVDEPFELYNNIAIKHRPFRPISQIIADSSVIHPSTVIEPNAIIGPNVTIGKNCHIQANVTIHEYSKIGDNVLVQSGSVIGSDAFYMQREPNKLTRWRSSGRAILENDVEIGACCTVNKGVSGDTIVGEGTKFDCLIHIGHGAVVGKHCLFAAQVGIGGKTIIGDRVVLYGQVGIAQNLNIEDDVTVLAKSGVSKNLEKGKVYFGTPAREARQILKEIAALRDLANNEK